MRFGFAMKPTAWSKFLEGGDDKNLTINHSCSGGNCGGSGNYDSNSDGGGGGGDGGGSSGDGGGRESDGGVGGGRYDDSDERQPTTGDIDGGGCPCLFQSMARFDSVMGDAMTGAIDFEQGGDENITINHSCMQGEAGRQAAR